MNQCPMSSFQIMNILNQNQMMKNMVYTLIQNSMMMNQMVNILNTLIYNPMILNEIKIFRNKELNMMNMFNTNLINIFNNVNNTNTFQNTNQINTQDKEITIIFQKKTSLDQRKRLTCVQCLPNEKISDVIQKYREKSGDNDQSLKFIYNSYKLNPELTVKQADLLNNSNVFVIVTQGIVGGDCRTNIKPFIFDIIYY